MTVENQTINDPEKEIAKNDKISQEEIDKIESISTALDQTESNNIQKKLEQTDHAFLEDIRQECQDIFKKYDRTQEMNENEIKAVLSLLRIYQITHPGSINIPINISGDIQTMNKIIGDKPERFSIVLGEDGVNMIKNNIQIQNNKEQQRIENDIIRKKAIYEDNETPTNIDSGKAKIYIQNMLNTITEGTVQEKYQQVKQQLLEDPTLSKAIDALLNKCKELDKILFGALDGELTFTKDTMRSSKIKQFQELASKNEDYKTILGNGLKSGIDGKLGFNTISAILKITELVEYKYRNENQGTTFNESIKGIEIDKGSSIDEVPHSITDLNKIGFIRGMIFNVYDGMKEIERTSTGSTREKDPNAPDYIQEETGTGRTFLQIGEKKYYTDGKGGEYQMVQNRTDNKQEILFGKVKEENGKWILIDGTKITLDNKGNQIRSTTTGPELSGEKGQEKQQLGITRLKGKIIKGEEGEKSEGGNNKDQEDRFEAKWRIILFDENGKDTKRMNSEQLDRLLNDKNALTRVLDQTITAYQETQHKPSTIGRYNLNRIIKGILNNHAKQQEARSDFAPYYFNNGSPKECVQALLGLRNGIDTDPTDSFSIPKIPEDPKKGSKEFYESCRQIGFKKVLKDQYNPDNEKTAGDRIRNGLIYLSTLVKNDYHY